MRVFNVGHANNESDVDEPWGYLKKKCSVREAVSDSRETDPLSEQSGSS